jgi:hypothetical protein
VNLAHLMIDTIYVAAPSGKSNAGDFTYAAAASQTARVEKQTNVVADARGNDATTQYVIATETEIPLESRIWFALADTSDVTKAIRCVSTKYARALNGSYAYYIHFA